LSQAVLATNGRTNAIGCHYDGYQHCHNELSRIDSDAEDVVVYSSTEGDMTGLLAGTHWVLQDDLGHSSTTIMPLGIRVWREIKHNHETTWIELDPYDSVMHVCGSVFTLQQQGINYAVSLLQPETCSDACWNIADKAQFMLGAYNDAGFDPSQRFALIHHGYNQTPMRLAPSANPALYVDIPLSNCELANVLAYYASISSDNLPAAIETAPPALRPSLGISIPYMVYIPPIGLPLVLWADLVFDPVIGASTGEVYFRLEGVGVR
jgi:hypothetical protein